MKLLREITPEDLGLKADNKVNFVPREATRAIVFNEDGLIALLYVSKNSYHKIPGGGIEQGEDRMMSLEREIIEEVGAKIEVSGEVGEIYEKRIYEDGRGTAQKSYCYLANVVGEIAEPSFTEKELKNGFKVVWVPLDEAIELLASDRPQTQSGRFIQIRDLTFLKEASAIRSKSD